MKNTLKARQNTRRRNYERRSFLRMERLEDRMVLSGASPVAVNDLYQAIIDEPLSISPTAGVLANDTDAEGDTSHKSVLQAIPDIDLFRPGAEPWGE